MESGSQNQVRRWLALLVVCVGQLMIVLDSTIVNVALPSIQRDLHFTQADLTWVVNAYLVTYGSLLLLAGFTSEERETLRSLLQRVLDSLLSPAPEHVRS